MHLALCVYPSMSLSLCSFNLPLYVFTCQSAYPPILSTRLCCLLCLSCLLVCPDVCLRTASLYQITTRMPSRFISTYLAHLEQPRDIWICHGVKSNEANHSRWLTVSSSAHDYLSSETRSLALENFRPYLPFIYLSICLSVCLSIYLSILSYLILSALVVS